MLKFWLYIIILALLCMLGLTIGSANESLVTFDFLFVKAELSLAMVMVAGMGVGVVLGLYIASLFCMKMWAKAHSARSEARKAEAEVQKALEAVRKAEEQAQKAISERDELKAQQTASTAVATSEAAAH